MNKPFFLPIFFNTCSLFLNSAMTPYFVYNMSSQTLFSYLPLTVLKNAVHITFEATCITLTINLCVTASVTRTWCFLFISFYIRLYNYCALLSANKNHHDVLGLWFIHLLRMHALLKFLPPSCVYF